MFRTALATRGVVRTGLKLNQCGSAIRLRETPRYYQVPQRDIDFVLNETYNFQEVRCGCALPARRRSAGARAPCLPRAGV